MQKIRLSAVVAVILAGAGIAGGQVETLGSVLVTDGAKLGGGGSIDANVTFESGATCEVILTNSDRLVVGGMLELGGATLDFGGTTISEATTVISADRVSSNFYGLPEAAEVQQGYYIHYIDEAGNSSVLINLNSTPTSSGIDLRAYQAADGVYVEFAAYDVESAGRIRLVLPGADGKPAWSGAVETVAGPEFIARFKVPGLEAGQVYSFQVQDETGKWWTASGVKVGDFNTEMVGMTPAGTTVVFNSIPGREYEVQWAAALGDEWLTVETVRAESASTSVEILFASPEHASGFYRVRLR